MSAPQVVVAIPTLLGGSALHTCLETLDRQNWRDFEVIVVNNGDDSHVPDGDTYGFPLRVIRPGFNAGFGGAINMAVKSTVAPMIAVLNDDTEAESDWLRELVREMDANPRAGMCASSIRLLASGRMDSAGMYICLDGSSKQRGGSMAPAAFDSSGDVLFPSACAALYRRQMLEEIGAFDSDFFLYCEDTDLGLRAVWAGWQCRYAARACVRHCYSRTVQPFSALKARYVERNRLWVVIKSFPVPLLLLVPFASATRYAWQLWHVFFGSGAAAEFRRSGSSVGSALAIVVQAHVETLKHLPLLLRKRAKIVRTRRISTREFIRLVMRHRITVRELARA